MDNELKGAICAMKQRITDIIDSCMPSIYLYGSVVLNDFKPGWSDIDLLVLTQAPISPEQADLLVGLRQTMLEEEPGNPYYRSFEGGILPLNDFLSGQPERVVYWGTSGERMTDRYDFDAFSMTQLLDSGILLYGKDIRDRLSRPAFDELKTNVRRHYEAIRKYAQRTEGSLYSYGWLLDISRCIYTLRTGKIIAKTAAGDWALQKALCPCAEALGKAIEVRKEPNKYKNDARCLAYAETLGPSIQVYADVLEAELREQ